MSIPIFIGTSPNGEDRDIERIYEYSLRKNSSQDLQIHWMKLSDDKSSIWGGWNTSKWFTPFSGLRWAIPHACNFQGKAIYTDVDMINQKDISDLYNIDMEAAENLIVNYTGAKFHSSFLGAQLAYYFMKLSTKGQKTLLTQLASYAMSQVPGISCVHAKYE